MAGKLPVIGAVLGAGQGVGGCKGTVSGLWKIMEIYTGHVSPQSIATEEIPTDI